MSADTSGANLLPGRSNLHQHPRSEPEWEPDSRDAEVLRGRWWQNLPEGISARRARRTERARLAREFDHQAEHPDIPLNLIEALQHGISPDEPLTGVTVAIDDQHIHIAISDTGTGIPEPDSQGVWDGLCDTFRDISTSPYCADIVRPLPQEIAAIGWTTPAGQTVNVTPCKPPRLKGLLAVALFPLARAGDLVALSVAGSAAAALVLGTSSLSTGPSPVEPPPDLQQKTSITAQQRIPQAAGTHHPSQSGRTKATVQTSTPRPVTTPATTRSATPTRSAPPTGPAPTGQPETTPKPPEPAPTATPPHPVETVIDTVIGTVTSLLQGGAS